MAKKDQEVAAQEEVTLKKQQAFSNPAAVSFVSNPSTSKVILIHPMSRDSRDPRDSKISSKSITLRNDLKTPTQPHSHQKQHGAKGIQSIQPTPSIEIRQIPPFKKVQSQNQLTNNLLPTVHLKNEKTKKSRSLEKKNLAESAANKS